MQLKHLVTALTLSGLTLAAFAGHPSDHNVQVNTPALNLSTQDLSFAHQSRHSFSDDHMPSMHMPSPSCIPEPGTVGMLALGLLGIGLIRARTSTKG